MSKSNVYHCSALKQDVQVLSSVRQCTAQGGPGARTAWVKGAGFLLARRRMRWRTCATCLSEASCGTCSPSLAFFGKLRGTLPESLKCPRPRSSLRVSLAKLFAIGIRLYRRLIRRMFSNNLLHPDHIIPPVKLIPAVLKSPAKPEPKVLMELGTVLI